MSVLFMGNLSLEQHINECLFHEKLSLGQDINDCLVHRELVIGTGHKYVACAWRN